MIPKERYLSPIACLSMMSFKNCRGERERGGAADATSSPLFQDRLTRIVISIILTIPLRFSTRASAMPNTQAEGGTRLPATSGKKPAMSHVPPDFAITHFLSEGHLSLDLINSEHFDYRGRRSPQD